MSNEEIFIWKSPNKKWEISTFDGEFRVYDTVDDKWYRVEYSDEVNPLELKKFPMYVRVELAFYFASPPASIAEPDILMPVDYSQMESHTLNEEVAVSAEAVVAPVRTNNHVLSLHNVSVTEKIREIPHIRCCHVVKGIHLWGTIVGGYSGFLNDKVFFTAYHIIFDNGKRQTVKANSIHIPKKGRDKM